MEREFDVIVIGAGPAGEVIAGRLSKRGRRRVAIVERHLVGGECAYYACMPSKALLRPGELLKEAQHVPGTAEAVDGGLDVQAVLSRRDEVIHNLSDQDQLPWLSKREIELVRGEGRLDGERRVIVGDDVLVAHEAVVLAVGSAPVFPPIPGLDEVAAWLNRETTTAGAAPESLLVLGGGFVGVEMAQAWSSLGSRVTVIEALDKLISHEEPLASDAVHRALEEDGVEVLTGVRAEEVCREGEKIKLSLADGSTVSGQRLLVGIGRRPLTSDLGLDTVGLPEGEFVEVDSQLRVNGMPWLYAVGDVTGRSLLTHAGKYQARIAADSILGEDASAWADGEKSPRVIFTDPQVAAVGLTLESAHEQGISAEAFDLETNANAGGSFYGRSAPGTTRFVVDVDVHVLVGATFVGAEITDFLHSATIAVVGEVPLRTIAHAIAAFPTRSELWLDFLEEYEQRHGVSLHARGS